MLKWHCRRLNNPLKHLAYQCIELKCYLPFIFHNFHINLGIISCRIADYDNVIGFRVSFYCHYLPKCLGKYVRLSVCLSASLSVLSSITHERFDISSPNLVHICTG